MKKEIDDPWGEELIYDDAHYKNRIVSEKIIRKWKPILDALKVEDVSIKILMSEYAEHHTLEQNCGYGSEFKQNTLPISMRVFSKLNLENKNIIFRSDLPITKLSIELTQSQYDDIKNAWKMDVIQKMEKVLIEKLTNYINSELETKDTINIQLLINRIDVEIESEKLNKNKIKTTPKMYIIGNFSFE